LRYGIPPGVQYSEREDVTMQESILVDDAGRNRLLATKFFVPASPHTLIPRQRLHALLDECLHYTVTLLSAPAGFGKTTLLSQWLKTRSSEDASVAWVSLDEGDNDPVRFWTYVFTALEPANQDSVHCFCPSYKLHKRLRHFSLS
jgi:ATP/maltotriose-dependent transcriptional regulator MalT